MTIKKSLTLKAWAFAIIILMCSGKGFAEDIDPAIQEQVIQELAAESRQELEDYEADPFARRTNKIILKGYWDAKARKLMFKLSTKQQLAEDLKLSKLPLREKVDFFTARNLVLASLSAGGILYFVPHKSIVFWETDENEVPEIMSGDKFWTNPVIGNLLSGFLVHAQKEVGQNATGPKGSSTLKSFMMIILNPAAALANKIRSHKTTEGQTKIITEAPIGPDTYQPMEQKALTNYIGINFTFRF